MREGGGMKKVVGVERVEGWEGRRWKMRFSPVVSKHGEGVNVVKLSIAPPTKPHPYISHKYLSTLQK